MNKQKTHESDSWNQTGETELTGRDLREILSLHPELNSSEVDIKFEDGYVTLDGIVETMSDKRQIETLASQISGVKEVFNLLELRRPPEPWKRNLKDESRGENQSKGLY